MDSFSRPVAIYVVVVDILMIRQELRWGVRPEEADDAELMTLVGSDTDDE